MAINFTTGAESAFSRIGRILHLAYSLRPYQAALPAQFIDINNGYTTTLLPVGGQVSVQADSLVRVSSGVMSFASSAAWNVVVGMVLADVPSQGRSQQAAMNEFIRQMKLQSKTVQANTIALSQAALSGSVGSGVLVLSPKRGDGLVNENIIAEVGQLTCTADAYTGGATQGQETFALSGSPNVAGVWDYDWPTGSNAGAQANAVSAADDGNTAGNLLTNGDFQSWSTDPAPQLQNWVLGVGTWGTSIQRNSTNPLLSTESYAVQFNAGATLNALYQVFNDTAGTPVTPIGLASYQVNFWLRKLSGTITGGVLTVELVDGSGTVTNDAQGTANSFTVTLSTLTTSYVAYNATFRLNGTPPTAVWLRFRITTALAGAAFLLADACYAAAQTAYTGGYGWNVFSGATPFVGGDGWQITSTNNQGGASYLGTFQTGFQRLFSMTQLGLLLPSSGSPNVANTLISA